MRKKDAASRRDVLYNKRIFSHSIQNLEYCIKNLEFDFLKEEERLKLEFARQRVFNITYYMMTLVHSSNVKSEHYHNYNKDSKSAVKSN